MLQAVIRRGELDRSITFVKPVYSRGGANQDKIDSWAEIDAYPTVFARKREMNGRELVVNDQIKFMQNTEFVVVYREDINETNRIVWNDRVYEIVSITELGLQRASYLQIIAMYLDNEDSPLVEEGGGFSGSAFSPGFNIGTV